MTDPDSSPRKGRGAQSNANGRYEPLVHMAVDDGWQTPYEDPDTGNRTHWRDDAARSVISRNDSPDLHFDRSVNPYRGCEHGCIYCFARPTHAWLGHSPGLDFERLLYAKRAAPDLLQAEMAKPGYRPEVIAIGVNTDAWQPLERKLGITRKLLALFANTRHPVLAITKSHLIERDIDLLTELAQDQLVVVSITITTLDHELARRLEPRATAPGRRLRTIERLAVAGIPVRLSLSPVIPALNEHEIDGIVQASADAGVMEANAIMLRLPHELSTLFPEWLQAHYPDRAERVLKAIRSVRNSKLNESDFQTRMLGTGPRADVIQQRFKAACKRAGILAGRRPLRLDGSKFRPPGSSRQMSLFG